MRKIFKFEIFKPFYSKFKSTSECKKDKMLSKLNYWLYSFTKCKISILVCFCYNINELSETQTPLMKKKFKIVFPVYKKKSSFILNHKMEERS